MGFITLHLITNTIETFNPLNVIDNLYHYIYILFFTLSGVILVMFIVFLYSSM
jgi:hypothetical protein